MSTGEEKKRLKQEEERNKKIDDKYAEVDNLVDEYIQYVDSYLFQVGQYIKKPVTNRRSNDALDDNFFKNKLKKIISIYEEIAKLLHKDELAAAIEKESGFVKTSQEHKDHKYFQNLYQSILNKFLERQTQMQNFESYNKYLKYKTKYLQLKENIN
jgi:hypothetical protein